MLNSNEIEIIKQEFTDKLESVTAYDKELCNNSNKHLTEFYTEVLRIYFYPKTHSEDLRLLDTNPREFYRTLPCEYGMRTDLYGALTFASYFYDDALRFLDVLQNFIGNILDDAYFDIRYHTFSSGDGKYHNSDKSTKGAEPYIDFGMDGHGSQDASLLLDVLQFYKDKNKNHLKTIVDNLSWMQKG